MSKRHYRKTVFWLLALALPVLLAAAVFAVDVGSTMLVRTQLQMAADSAALAGAGQLGEPPERVIAAARQLAEVAVSNGWHVRVDPADVELGLWDAEVRLFTPTDEHPNAVRVTARYDPSSKGDSSSLVGSLVGRMHFAKRASAVAAIPPRDIAFVVDLSGVMNDDTEPAWATRAIDNRVADDPAEQGTGSAMAAALYEDLGFGPFPGELEHVGEPFGVAPNERAYTELTDDHGPLAGADVPAPYRIAAGDDESTRKRKAYSALIDGQIARLMPNAQPPADSSRHYEYWARYLDYVIRPAEMAPNRQTEAGAAEGHASRGGGLPPCQHAERIGDFNNPDGRRFPQLPETAPEQFVNQIGYRTYAQFLLDHGRDLKPDGASYAAHSRHNPECPRHREEVGGRQFDFPPRTQPMHAVRRSLIAAIGQLERHNTAVADRGRRDRVAVIAFDGLCGRGPVIRQGLTDDYAEAMSACVDLQAAGDRGATAALEAGLETAARHLGSEDEDGQGRSDAVKVVVLITPGFPDLFCSDTETIEVYRRDHPSPEFYRGDAYARDAAIMQVAKMRAEGWLVFAVGAGIGADHNFLDRLARVAGTADSGGQSPRGADDPARYGRQLVETVEGIVDRPIARLVQ